MRLLSPVQILQSAIDRSRSARRSSVKLVAGALLAAAAIAAPAKANIVNLADGNSTASFDTSTASAQYSWVVDGVEHLFQQGYYFRIGNSGGEHSVQSLTQDSISSGTNFLNVKYSGDTFDITLSYTLTGGSNGSGQATIVESAKVENVGASTAFKSDFISDDSALDLHLFSYTDMDLNNSSDDDSVQFSGNNTVDQTDPFGTIAENVVTPGASHVEVATWPGLTSSLNNSSPTTLNDDAGPLNNTDCTYGFQWDATVPLGGSFLVSKVDTITGGAQAIPLPSAAWMGLVGLAGLAVATRMSRKVSVA